MQVREALSWLQGCLISPISWRWKSGSLLKNDKVSGKTSFRAATHEVELSLLKTILPYLFTTFVVSLDHLCFLLWKLRERCFVNWALQIAVALDPWMPGATRIGQPVSLWPGWRICCIVDERVLIIFFLFSKKWTVCFDWHIREIIVPLRLEESLLSTKIEFLGRKNWLLRKFTFQPSWFPRYTLFLLSMITTVAKFPDRSPETNYIYSHTSKKIGSAVSLSQKPYSVNWGTDIVWRTDTIFFLGLLKCLCGPELVSKCNVPYKELDINY